MVIGMRKKGMKRGIRLGLMVLITIGILGNSGCGAGKTSVSEKQVWKVSLTGNSQNTVTYGFQVFEEELEKRVGNQVDVQLFTDGQLGSSTDQMLGGLQNGIIEMSDVTLGNLAEYSQAFIPLDIPYLVLNREEALALMDGEAGDLMKQRYEEETGIKLVGVFDFGFRQMTNNKRSIIGAEDFSGMKIRTMNNNIHIEAFRQFGAVSTTMAYSEIFTGLQQGTIDGQENPLTSILESKFYEVQDYLTLTEHLYGTIGMHMSKELYDSQTDEVKKAIEEAAAIAVEKQRAACKEANEKALEDLEQTGQIEINVLSENEKEKLRECMAPIIQEVGRIVGEDYLDDILNQVKSLEGNG